MPIKIINNITQKINLPIFEIELILAHVLKKPREYIIAHPEHELTKLQIANCKLQIAKRLKGLPIAYITGHKEFYGLDFFVNKNVLIPRPETEFMVDEALRLATHSSQPITLIDVGTGSGCIVITLAKNLSNSKFIGIDISSQALLVARKNAKFHSVNKKIKFLRGSLLSPLKIQNSKLIILANLPYLTPSQIKDSPTIKYEPKSALSAGSDGLKYYRQLFKRIKDLRDAHVLCEIDPGQTKKIKQLVKCELPEAAFQIKKDLSGLNRLVVISINN